MNMKICAEIIYDRVKLNSEYSSFFVLKTLLAVCCQANKLLRPLIQNTVRTCPGHHKLDSMPQSHSRTARPSGCDIPIFYENFAKIFLTCTDSIIETFINSGMPVSGMYLTKQLPPPLPLWEYRS